MLLSLLLGKTIASQPLCGIKIASLSEQQQSQASQESLGLGALVPQPR